MHEMSEKLGNYLDKETEEDCAHHCYQGSIIDHLLSDFS